MDDNIKILVTFIEKETLDIIKIAMQIKVDSPLGQNYSYYGEEDVKILFPTPNKDKIYRISDVSVIDDIIMVPYGFEESL